MNTLDTENKIPENTNIVVDTIQCKNKFARVIELLEPNHISDEDDYNIQGELRELINFLFYKIPELDDLQLIDFYRTTLNFGDSVPQEHYELLVKGIRVSKDIRGFALAIFAPFGLNRTNIEGGGVINILELATSRHGGFWKSRLLEYEKDINTTQPIAITATEEVVYIDNGAIEVVPEAIPKLSKAKQGKIDRREKTRERTTAIIEDKELERKRIEYQKQLEVIQSLGQNIEQQLTEFSRFLTIHIPYIAEAIEYLRMLSDKENLDITKAQLSGSLNEESKGGEISAIKQEINQTDLNIAFFEREITLAKGKIALELKKDTPVSLVITNANSHIRKLYDKRNKALRAKERREKKHHALVHDEKERREKNKERTENIKQQISDIDKKIAELESTITDSRIKGIPTIDEFISGIYTSLRAQEFYIKPDTFTEKQISMPWIESNILKLFIDIISSLDSLDRQIIIEGISFPQIVELSKNIEGIDTIDTSYNIDSLPDISHVSQTKIARFITVLSRIVPADIIDTIPSFTINKKEPKEKPQRKTKSEKRKKEAEQSIANTKEKEEIKEMIESLEEKQKGFQKYWEIIVGGLKSEVRAILRAIQAINIDNPIKSGPYRGKNIDEIHAQKNTKITEGERVQDIINLGNLNTDTDEFERIRKESSKLKIRLSRLKNKGDSD